MNITTEIVEGFMGVQIPVVKLNDGSIEFWIPEWDWERVRDALSEALED